MSDTRTLDIAFNDGQDESIDRVWLPNGKLRALFNGRLTRDGRLEVRPGYTSLSRSSVSFTGARFHAFDLTTYQGQLIALGTEDTASYTPAYPNQVYTYIGSQGWTTQTTSSFAPQLSCVTELRALWQAPYGNTMTNSDIAYANGYVCVCTTDQATSGCSVYVLDAETGVVVAQRRESGIDSARVAACGNIFLIVFRNTSSELVAGKLDTTDLAAGFTGSFTITTGAGGSLSWDLSGYDSTNALVSYNISASSLMRLRFLTTSLTAAAGLSVGSKNGNSAVIGNPTNGIVWAFTDGNDVELRTVNASLSVTVGPTDVLGPSSGALSGSANVVGTPALAFINSTTVAVHAENAGSLGIGDSVFTFRALSDHSESEGDRNGNVNIRSKLYSIEAPSSSTSDRPLGVGTLIVDGNTSGTDQVYADCIQGTGTSEATITAAVWNYGVADKLDAAASSSSKHGRSSVATDGSGTFWAVVGVLDESGLGTANRGTPQVVRFKSGTNERRQTAEMQGALYVAGGFTYYYDRGTIPAESGFLDTPVISQITQGTAGSLTQLATYRYVAVYEWQDAQGRLHRSTPSTPRSVTLTGSNDETFVQVSTPRSLRRAPLSGDANACKIVIYRTMPGDSVFFRVAETSAAGSATYADVANANDQTSDAVAQTRPILYIQSQKPTANVAAQPCRFMAAGRDRIIYGGHPDPYLVRLSQLTFPAEPVENASPNAFAFQTRLPEPVTAVEAFGDSYIAFTADAIYAIPGAGPQRNGSGEFFAPQALDTDGGCIDWRSVVSCAEGTFFQSAADRLCILRPGGGVEWIGQPIRDTLATYPVITGSVLCTATPRVVFSCTNSAGDAGVLLAYDLRRKVWSVDTVGAVTAVTEYDGRLAYVQGGLVYLEDAAIAQGSGALPTLSPRTGSIAPFGPNGRGHVCEVIALVTYLGDATVEGFISYDDGVTWTSMGSHTVTAVALSNIVTGNALTSGDTIPLSFDPQRHETSRFSLRIDVTNATNTGGSRLHGLSITVQQTPGLVRLPAAYKR